MKGGLTERDRHGVHRPWPVPTRGRPEDKPSLLLAPPSIP